MDPQEMFYEELRQYDSPIERMMAAGLIWLTAPQYRPGLILDGFSFDTHRQVSRPAGQAGPTIWRQAAIGRYRADFLLRWEFERFYFFAVECDGHEFHSRTKAQIERDKERDNYFLGEDIPTFRFAGSTIYGDAIGSARSALEKTGALALQRACHDGGLHDVRGLRLHWADRIAGAAA
jgi:very-short-patch-repair endonuclease